MLTTVTHPPHNPETALGPDGLPVPVPASLARALARSWACYKHNRKLRARARGTDAGLKT